MQARMFRTLETRLTGLGDAFDGPIHHDPEAWSGSRWPFRKFQAQTATDRLTEKATQATTYRLPSHKHARDNTLRQRSILSVFLGHALVLLAFLIPVATFALTLSVPKLYKFRANNWANTFTHCNYDGTFTPYDTPSKSLWDKAGFFDINVAWGKMGFSTAKFIDIVWDVGAGRAGQALIGYVTFRVTSQYLAMAMHESPVSYTTFESLAFVAPSLVRTGRLAGDLLTNRGWRARLAMVWILFSSLFVISFSSFATAMSGYSSDTTTVMPDYDGIDAAWADYEVVQFAINDAWRVGQPGPVTIARTTSCVRQGLSANDNGNYDGGDPTITYHRRDGSENDRKDDPWEYVPSNCTLFWRMVEYVSTYGLQAASKEPSTFILAGVTHNLTTPSLNITTSYSSASISLLSSYLENISNESTHVLNSVSKISPSTFWIYNNQTYSYEYVMSHATCRYTGFHNWGFSFLLLCTSTLLLAIWAVGTYILWLYVYLHGPHDERSGFGITESFGIYSSSWTLVEAIKRDLGPDVVTSGMTEREVRSLVRRRPERANGIAGVGAGQPMSVSTTGGQMGTHSDLQAPTCHSTRWEEFRAWLRPRQSSLPPSRDGMHIHNMFSILSPSSQHPSLAPRSPSTPYTASFTSPSPSSIFTFSNQPTTPTDMLAGTTVDAGVATVPGRKSRPGLSRLISKTSSHTSTSCKTPRSVSTSSTPWWLPMSSSSTASISAMAVPSHLDTNSPVSDSAASLESRPWEKAAMRAGDATKFKNDLGDDQT
ncbi:hypothetical protein PV11_04783 [Exophiala sideris]|uniref:Uncharacterized protein n=1 Tax=Exophiala sideris TaxID=1016849 RepID=A0A0D1YII6_9EURO|nr:hypothetical protein PV11_04783 [Exophiala sideris]